MSNERNFRTPILTPYPNSSSNPKAIIQLLVQFGSSLDPSDMPAFLSWIFQMLNKSKKQEKCLFYLRTLQEFLEFLSLSSLAALRPHLDNFSNQFEAFVASLPSVNNFIGQILSVYQRSALYSINVYRWMDNVFHWCSSDPGNFGLFKEHLEKMQKHLQIKSHLVVSFILDRIKLLPMEIKPFGACTSIALFLDSFSSLIIQDPNPQVLVSEWLLVIHLVRLNHHTFNSIYQWDVLSNRVIETLIRACSDSVRALNEIHWKSILDLINFQLAPEGPIHTSKLLNLLRSHLAILSAAKSHDALTLNEALILQNSLFALQTHPDSRIVQTVTLISTFFADLMGLFFCGQIQNCIANLHNPIFASQIMSNLIILNNIRSPQMASECLTSLLGIFPQELASADAALQIVWCSTIEKLLQIAPVTFLQWLECGSLWCLLNPDNFSLFDSRISVPTTFKCIYQAPASGANSYALVPSAIASLLKSTNLVLCFSVSPNSTFASLCSKWHSLKIKDKIHRHFVRLYEIAIYWMSSDNLSVKFSASKLLLKISERISLFEHLDASGNEILVNTLWELVLSNAPLYHVNETIRSCFLDIILNINRLPPPSLFHNADFWKRTLSQVQHFENNPEFQKGDFRDIVVQMLPISSTFDLTTPKIAGGTVLMAPNPDNPENSIYSTFSDSKSPNDHNNVPSGFPVVDNSIVSNSDAVYRIALFSSHSSCLALLFPSMGSNVMIRQIWAIVESALFFTSDKMTSKLSFLKDGLNLLERALHCLKKTISANERQYILQWLFWVKKVLYTVVDDSVSFSLACNEQAMSLFVLNRHLFTDYLCRFRISAFQVAASARSSFDVVEHGSQYLLSLLKDQFRITTSQWPLFTEELAYVLVSFVGALVSLRDADCILGLHSLLMGSLRPLGSLPATLTFWDWMLAAHFQAIGHFSKAQSLYLSVLKNFDDNSGFLTPQDHHCHNFLREKMAECSLILGNWDEFEPALRSDSTNTFTAVNSIYKSVIGAFEQNLKSPNKIDTFSLQRAKYKLVIGELSLIDPTNEKLCHHLDKKWLFTENDIIHPIIMPGTECLEGALRDALTNSSVHDLAHVLSVAQIIKLCKPNDTASPPHDFSNIDLRFLIRIIHLARISHPSLIDNNSFVPLATKARKSNSIDLAWKIITEFSPHSLAAEIEKIKILHAKGNKSEADKTVWENFDAHIDMDPKDPHQIELFRMACKLPPKASSDDQTINSDLLDQLVYKLTPQSAKSWMLFANMNFRLGKHLFRQLKREGSLNCSIIGFDNERWREMGVEDAGLKAIAFRHLRIKVLSKSTPIDSELFSEAVGDHGLRPGEDSTLVLEEDIHRHLEASGSTQDVAEVVTKVRKLLIHLETLVWQPFKTAIHAYSQFLKFQADSPKFCITAILRVLQLLTRHRSKLMQLGFNFDEIPAKSLSQVFPQVIAGLGHADPFVRSCFFSMVSKIMRLEPRVTIFPLLIRCALSSDLLSDQSDLLAKLKSEFTSFNAELVDQMEFFLTACRRITSLWDENLLACILNVLSFLKLRYRALTDGTLTTENNTLSEPYSVLIRSAFSKLEELLSSDNMHEFKIDRNFKAIFIPRLTLLLRDLTDERIFDVGSTLSSTHLEFFIDELGSMVRELHKSVRRSFVSLGAINSELGYMRKTEISLPGFPLGITIHGVRDYVQIFPTKNRPKKIVFLGSDGREYPYLLKSNENFHLDERIMQFISVVNLLLKKDTITRNRELSCTNYFIVPVGKNSTLIQWIDGATPLNSLFTEWLKRRNFNEKLESSSSEAKRNPIPSPSTGERNSIYKIGKSIKSTPSTTTVATVSTNTIENDGTFDKKTLPFNFPGHCPINTKPVDLFYSKLFSQLNSLGISNIFIRSEWPPDIVKKVFSELEYETQSDILAQELALSSSCTSEWYSKTRTYGRSLAVTSIVGYVLGIGDRHLDNILIDLSSGSLIHIDYSVCFDLGLKLPVPEVVPFRLTQNFVHALGPGGLRGIFQTNAIETFRVIRHHQEPLLTLLETFMYDPLVDWIPDKTTFTECNFELESTLRLLSDRLSSFIHHWEDSKAKRVSSVKKFAMEFHKLKPLIEHYTKVKNDWNTHKQQYKNCMSKIHALEDPLAESHFEDLNCQLSNVQEQRIQLQKTIGSWRNDLLNKYHTIIHSLSSFASDDGLEYLNKNWDPPMKSLDYLSEFPPESCKSFKTTQKALDVHWERINSAMKKTVQMLITYNLVLKQMPQKYLQSSSFKKWIHILNVLEFKIQSKSSDASKEVQNSNEIHPAIDTQNLHPHPAKTPEQHSPLQDLNSLIYGIEDDIHSSTIGELSEIIAKIPPKNISKIRHHIHTLLEATMDQSDYPREGESFESSQNLQSASVVFSEEADINQPIRVNSEVCNLLMVEWVEFKSKNCTGDFVIETHKSLSNALKHINNRQRELKESLEHDLKSNLGLQSQVNNFAIQLRKIFFTPPGLANPHVPSLQLSIILSLIDFRDRLMSYHDETSWIFRVREVHAFLLLWNSVTPFYSDFLGSRTESSRINEISNDLDALSLGLFDGMQHLNHWLKGHIIDLIFPILGQLFDDLNNVVTLFNSTTSIPEIKSLTGSFFSSKFSLCLGESHLKTLKCELDYLDQIEIDIKNSLVQVNWQWEHLLHPKNDKMRSNLLFDLNKACSELQSAIRDIPNTLNHYSTHENQILLNQKIELKEEAYQLIKRNNHQNSALEFKELVSLRCNYWNELTDYVQTLVSLVGCIMKFELARSQPVTEYVDRIQNVEEWLSMLHTEAQLIKDLTPLLKKKKQAKIKKIELEKNILQIEVERSLDVQLLKNLEDEINNLLGQLDSEVQDVRAFAQMIRVDFKQVEFLIDSIIKINQKVDSGSGKLLRTVASKLKELYKSWEADMTLLETKIFSLLKKESGDTAQKHKVAAESKSQTIDKMEKQPVETKQRSSNFKNLICNRDLWNFVATFNSDLVKKQLDFEETILELQKSSLDWLGSDRGNNNSIAASKQPPASNINAIGLLKKVKQKIEGSDQTLMQAIFCNEKMSTGTQVDALIKLSIDRDNLARMYEGWTAWI